MNNKTMPDYKVWASRLYDNIKLAPNSNHAIDCILEAFSLVDRIAKTKGYTEGFDRAKIVLQKEYL